jgi:hypothetical protein
MEVLPIRVFAAGLGRTPIKMAVYRNNPPTMTAALAAAQQELSVLDQLNPDVSDGRGGYVVQKPPGINHLSDEAIMAIDQHTQCHACKGYGHIKSNCPKAKKGDGRKAPPRDSKGRDAKRNSERRAQYKRAIAAVKELNDGDDTDDDNVEGDNDDDDDQNSEEQDFQAGSE